MKYLLCVLLAVNLYATAADENLQKLALDNGLKPMPSNFESLLKTLNTDSKELSKEKITLGKKLFFEKDLSLNRDISCVSCHGFDKGGADAKPTAIGHKDQENPFHLNTPTVFNTAFSNYFFWNGRSESLQDQAKGPMQALFEMSITPELAERRINRNKTYKKMFRNAYGSSEITFEKIANAISAYEKTIMTRGRYDDFLNGDLSALDKEEKEGLNLFITKSCVGCHNGVGLGGQTLRRFPLVHHGIWSMSQPAEIQLLRNQYADFLEELDDLKQYLNFEFRDDKSRLDYMKLKLGEKQAALIREGFFHQFDENESLKVMTSRGCLECHDKRTNNVKKDVERRIVFPFENKGGFLGAEKPDRYFRVPLLRNTVRTKPYFHNGGVEKLEDAIRLMARHQSRISIKDKDIEKIIKFLKAVDGEVVNYVE